ncbi:hypothetical protein GCM10027072_48560 [Streptomyces bullii]
MTWVLAPTAVTPSTAGECPKLRNSGSGNGSRSSGVVPKTGAHQDAIDHRATRWGETTSLGRRVVPEA